MVLITKKNWGGWWVQSVNAWINILVDNTDPLNPIVNSLSDRYRTSSTTTNSISTPNTELTFTVDALLSYIANQDILIVADASNSMNASIISYDSVTWVLVVKVEKKSWSGTYSYWDIWIDWIPVVSNTTRWTINWTLSDQTDLQGELDTKVDKTIRNIKRQWISQSNVSPVNLWITMVFTGGTSLPTTTNTNFFTSQTKAWLAVAATANAIAWGRHSWLLVNRGNGNNTGWFYWYFTGGWDDVAYVANARNFCWLWGTNWFMANADPSTQLNTLWFWWDTGDTDMQFFHNDAIWLATKVPITWFPANTNGADWYKHEIWCYPSDTVVYYKITKYDTAWAETVITGSVNSNLPASTTYMSPQIFTWNGGTALARRYGMWYMSLETNY